MSTARERQVSWRGVILLACAAIAAIAFVAVALQVVEGHADVIDREWAIAIHAHQSEFFDAVMITFTTIGSGPCLYTAILLVSALAWQRSFRMLSLILLANALLALLTNVLLKAWFVRQRPHLWDIVTRPETFSFPSGHAMSAMAVYGGIAAVLIGLFPKRRWSIVTAATIVITGVGLSRIYLGVHWPLDVLAGYAASVPFVVATVHIVHGLLSRTPLSREQQAPTPRS